MCNIPTPPHSNLPPIRQHREIAAPLLPLDPTLTLTLQQRLAHFGHGFTSKPQIRAFAVNGNQSLLCLSAFPLDLARTLFACQPA